MLPSVAAKKIEKGGYMILRPDSGDPLDAVLAALRAAEKVFGADVNEKGYKVPRGCGVIQGDGIDYSTLSRLLDGIIDAGYSIEVTFLQSAMRSCQGHNASHYVHWLIRLDTHVRFLSAQLPNRSQIEVVSLMPIPMQACRHIMTVTERNALCFRWLQHIHSLSG